MNTLSNFWLPAITKTAGVVSLLAILPLSALASPILWVDGSSGELATVDVSTGDLTLIGTNNIVGFSDIAFAPDGTLYGIGFINGGVERNSLYTINTTTAAATLVGTANVAGTVTAIGFGPNGALYGLLYDGTDNFLTTIDTTTGATTVIGTGFGNLQLISLGLAFVDGTFFAHSTGNSLYSINVATGAFTLVGQTGVPSALYGLATPDNVTLYGVADTIGAGTTSLYTISTSNGAASFDLTFGGGGLGTVEGGITFGPESAGATPEPATFLLAGTGLLMLGLGRKAWL